MLLLLLALTAMSAAPEPTGAPAVAAPDVAAPPLPTSAAEARLWADLERRLADPAAYQALVDGEATSFYEGRLFPYVLPVLALANRAQAPGADRDIIQHQMIVLLDRLIPEVTRRIRAKSADGIPDVEGYGTWTGQLALALGAWQLAGGDDRYEPLHRKLCDALLADLQARHGAPIDAYPGLVWTFDTVPVLLALRLRDRAVGLPGAEEAIQAHLAWVDAHLDPATSLPVSRLDLSTGRVLEGPRGADLGLRITLMAQLDRARASTLYAAFVQHFAVSAMGLDGFAEWPDGQSGRPDPDSGPVIAGLGMSSTGFGLGAARIMGDEARFARMDAELISFSRLLVPARPLLAPQAAALGLRMDTDAYLTGLLLGDLSMLWGVSWVSWGVERPS